MKIKYFILSITFLLANLIIQDGKTELLCSKKWDAKYVKINDHKVLIPSNGLKKILMTFHKDGRHEVSDYSKIEVGTWRFSKNKDSIFFTAETNFSNSMKIQSLTNKKLVLDYTNSGTKIALHLEVKE